MDNGSIVTIVSSLCGLAATIVSAPSTSKRWQHVASNELSLYSAMHESARTPEEMAIANLLKEDAFRHVLKGLGYRMSEDIPIKTNPSIVKGGMRSFFMTLVLDAMMMLIVFGDVSKYVQDILTAAAISGALYIAISLLGQRWPRSNRNPFYSQKLNDFQWSKREWQTRLISSEIDMLADEQQSIIDKYTGDIPMNPADTIRMKRIEDRVKEIAKLVDKMRNEPSKSDSLLDQH